MEYKFTTSAKKCSICKKAYEELEYFYSILTYDENLSEEAGDKKNNEQKKKEEFALELSRLDICQTCWDTSSHDKNFSWWRMQKAVKPKLPALKDADFLWQLFTQAQTVLNSIETPKSPEITDNQQDEQVQETAMNPHEISAELTQKLVEAEQFVYVSSLGLLRLKQLKLKGYKKIEQDDYLVFTFSNSKKEIAVKDPRLDSVTLQKLEVAIEKLSETKHEEDNK